MPPQLPVERGELKALLAGRVGQGRAPADCSIARGRWSAGTLGAGHEQRPGRGRLLTHSAHNASHDGSHWLRGLLARQGRLGRWAGSGGCSCCWPGRRRGCARQRAVGVALVGQRVFPALLVGAAAHLRGAGEWGRSAPSVSAHTQPAQLRERGRRRAPRARSSRCRQCRHGTLKCVRTAAESLPGTGPQRRSLPCTPLQQQGFRQRMVTSRAEGRGAEAAAAAGGGTGLGMGSQEGEAGKGSCARPVRGDRARQAVVADGQEGEPLESRGSAPAGRQRACVRHGGRAAVGEPADPQLAACILALQAHGWRPLHLGGVGRCTHQSGCCPEAAGPPAWGSRRRPRRPAEGLRYGAGARVAAAVGCARTQAAVQQARRGAGHVSSSCTATPTRHCCAP